MRTEPLLVVQDIHVKRGERTVLEGVTLGCAPGTLTGLLGPNGSGKTTLLKVAAGLLDAESGSITLCGSDLAGMERGEIARRLAVVPQERLLPADFTANEVVRMGRSPHLPWHGRESEADLAACTAALAALGAEDLAYRKCGRLSGGEQQKVTIARALAQQPQVLLLDEPSNHLDVAHAFAMLEAVVRWAREHRAAVLAVLHDLNLAAAFCDRVAVLHNGRIDGYGTPAEVLNTERISRVYGIALSAIPANDSHSQTFVYPNAFEGESF